MSNYQPPSSSPPPGYPYQPGPGWQEPPREGMGCGTKLLIGLGVCFALLLVVCCGIGGYGYYYVRNAVIQDPAQIVTMTDEISQIDVPPPLQPVGGMKMKVPFSSKIVVSAVFYADQPSGSMLMLMAMGDVFEGKDQEKMRQQVEQSFRQQGVQKGEGERLNVQETKHKELQIHGQPANFTIIKGVGADSKKPRIQVQGAFQGKQGPVMLILDADANTIDEDKAVEMLESIR